MHTSKTLTVLLTTSLLLAPVAFVLIPGYQVQAAGPPNVIATTLAFINGNVVTVQYSNIYFCNSSGPPTNSTSSPCVVGVDATKDPVPDKASNTLDVIVPFFLGTGTGIGPGTGGIFDPTLGANNFSQCPDNTSTLTCPNHPNFLDLTPVGFTVLPLPIHSHVLSGPNTNHHGGWWKLRVWLVLDPSIWPNPSTGACTAGTGCLTSLAALQSAGTGVVGPVPTTIYLFFNVVSSSAK